MENGKVEALPRTQLRTKEERHKKKSRKHLWGALFLELFLRELNESEEADGEESQIEQKREEASLAPGMDIGEFGIKICCFQGDEFKESIARTEIFCTRASEESPRMKRDTLELTLGGLGMTSLSECYNNIGRMMQGICFAAEKQIFRESFRLMRDYYDGAVPKESMRGLILGYCKIYLAAKESEESTLLERDRENKENEIVWALEEIYEYFSYANIRCAVLKNNEEGRLLVEAQRLPWRGTSYYNSDYYYACDSMKQLLRDVCDEITDTCKIVRLNFHEIEENTGLTWEGGLSYHGFWGYAQMQVNEPYGQYGMRNETLLPPEYFIYLYKNTYSQEDNKRFQRLKKEIEKLLKNKYLVKCEWKEYCTCENDYHNGRSYLPEQKKAAVWREEAWELFVKNFKLYRVAGNMELLYLGKKQETPVHLLFTEADRKVVCHYPQDP